MDIQTGLATPIISHYAGENAHFSWFWHIRHDPDAQLGLSMDLPDGWLFLEDQLGRYCCYRLRHHIGGHFTLTLRALCHRYPQGVVASLAHPSLGAYRYDADFDLAIAEVMEDFQTQFEAMV